MADKVMFKLGLQAKIPADGKAVNGTFYLTSDTHRLYIGQGNNAVPINAGVTFCDNFAELTTATTGETEQNLAGRMFFLKNDNILCVRSNNTWVQINSDTKLDSAQAEVAKILNTDDGKGACVTIQVQDTIGTNVKAPFNIKPKTDNVKVYAGEDGKTVEIGVSDGATHDLTSAEIKKKNENDPESQEVTVEGASLVLTGSNSTIDKVNIHGAGSVRISNTTDGILATGTEYTLDNVTTSAQDKGFNVAVSINNGGSKNNTFFPQIKYGATPQTVDFIKDTTVDSAGKTGIATLDVYTKGEVDSLFSSADAMVFKDAVSGVTKLPNSAENGWTYKYTGTIIAMSDAKHANTRIDSSAGWINSGDLFIASGKKVNNSLTGDWKWIHVPAGDDERYSLGKNSKGIGIALNVAGGLSDATAGDLVFNKDNKDNWITLTDAYADKTTTINVGHKLVAKDASTNVTVSSTNTSDQASAGPDGNTTLEIPVITPTVDAAGHITSLSQTTYKVIDSHNRLNKDETSLTVAGSNGTIKITPKIVMGDGETSVDANMTFSLKSESLTLTTTDKVITAELEWGQF